MNVDTNNRLSTIHFSLKRVWILYNFVLCRFRQLGIIIANEVIAIPIKQHSFRTTKHECVPLNNKNAFQYDVYRPLQWPSMGGCLPRRCLPGGVYTSPSHGQNS